MGMAIHSQMCSDRPAGTVRMQLEILILEAMISVGIGHDVLDFFVSGIIAGI